MMMATPSPSKYAKNIFNISGGHAGREVEGGGGRGLEHIWIGPIIFLIGVINDLILEDRNVGLM